MFLYGGLFFFSFFVGEGSTTYLFDIERFGHSSCRKARSVPETIGPHKSHFRWPFGTRIVLSRPVFIHEHIFEHFTVVAIQTKKLVGRWLQCFMYCVRIEYNILLCIERSIGVFEGGGGGSRVLISSQKQNKNHQNLSIRCNHGVPRQ